MEVKWNLNGNWLLTASRDHLCKLFDIRNLKEELQVFRGHKKEATGVVDVLTLVQCSIGCCSGIALTLCVCLSFSSCGLASCPRRSVCQRRFGRFFALLAHRVRTSPYMSKVVLVLPRCWLDGLS